MWRKKVIMLGLFAAMGVVWSVAPGYAAIIPGSTPEERAINGAKAYMKEKGLKNLTMNVLINTLQARALRHVGPEFEKATGIKLKLIEMGYTDMTQKVLAEAIAKSGAYHVIMHFADSIPDGVESGVLIPFEPFIERYKPDVEGFLKFIDMAKYKGKTYAFPGDGSAFGLWARKDLLENPKEKANYKAKYGYELGCPETWERLRDIAEFFTRDTNGDGKIDLYGYHGYRARNFASKWWLQRFLSMGKLPFDENMNPLIDGPEGVQATKQFVAVHKFMHPDVLGWGTAQHYPFWGSGKVATFLAWGSAMSYARNPARKPPMRDKVMACMIPGSRFSGRLIRWSVHVNGPLWMVSRYAPHPELAYTLAQWISSPKSSAKFVAFPRGVSKPYRKTHGADPGIQNTYGKSFLEVNEKHLQTLTPTIHLVAFQEYMDALDTRVLDVILGKTSAEEAMKRAKADWNRITNDVGRNNQIEAWKTQIPLYPKIDVPK